MKTIKFLSATLVVASVILISACTKKYEALDLTSAITGTYLGTLTTDIQKSVTNARVDVIKNGDNQIEIHCYGDEMDTTFTQRLFEDGDRIQMCSTGDDFYNEYGHEMNNQYMHHNMMKNSDGLLWSHHMDEEHTNGDTHFGNFNLSLFTFNYMFNMMSGDVPYQAEFKGTKK